MPSLELSDVFVLPWHVGASYLIGPSFLRRKVMLVVQGI